MFQERLVIFFLSVVVFDAHPPSVSISSYPSRLMFPVLHVTYTQSAIRITMSSDNYKDTTLMISDESRMGGQQEGNVKHRAP